MSVPSPGTQRTRRVHGGHGDSGAGDGLTSPRCNPSRIRGLVTSTTTESLRVLRLILCGLCVLPGLAPAAETDFNPNSEKSLRAFFANYCQECHGPEKQKGERRFDQLKLPVAHPDTLLDLQDAIDQLNLGEMPPAKATKRPSEAEVREQVAQLTKLVADGHARLSSTGGQTVLRRLNRREYLNTIGDLLGLNMLMFDPTTKFPRDQQVQHMDNIGDALRTSGYLLAQYLEAADQVVEKAFALTERPKEQTWRFTDDFRQQNELRQHRDTNGFKFMALYETINSTAHEGAYGPLLNFRQGVPTDGYYEVRVKAEAKFRNNEYDPNFFGTDLSMPLRLGVVAGTIKAGPLHQPQPVEPQLGEVVLKDDEPEWHTFRVWLDQGFTPRFTFPNGMLSIRTAYARVMRTYRDRFPEEVRGSTGIVQHRHAVLKYGQVPQIRIHEVEIRGPLVEQWPPAGQQAILAGKPFAPARMREILQAFATRAYRRPVAAEEVDRLMKVVETRRRQGRSDFDAMKDGLKAALSSPAFLYLVEPAAANAQERSLNAHALASRLSYFLWSTLPDAELRRVADSGELLRPETLLAQTRRMLAHPRSDAFVNGLLDSWLNLRALGDMPPDRGDFARYYTQNLQPLMKRETQLFARDLIERNDSILRFLDSDYTFVNRPLAQLYGMKDTVEPASGHEFRRVAIDPKQRGGLLGHGSVLTVSANGVETSPVTRGVWVLENILGTPPAPPPDNVPPIDPDIRGAKSMREILAKHRDNPTCYDCHRKIDPLGFALENFDPIGAWRAQYAKAAPIDSSGELPSGQKFEDIAGLKKLLLERQEPFARMLTERLLTYACGRRMEPLDRPAIDRIVAATQAEQYRFRDVIEQVVLSQTFRSK